MVENLKKVLSALNQQHKEVWLFAVLKMDEFVDSWSIIISAPWITGQNRDTEFTGLIGILRENLTKEELSSIVRIVFLSKTDHLIEELLKKNSGVVLKDEAVNGNKIHEGYVIESNAGLVWQPNTLFNNENSSSL